MTDRSGFTLLEVILAMTALALMAAICYGAFHLGIRAVQQGEVAVVTAQRLRAASDVLIRQIKSAAPYCARNEDLDVYPHFRGTASSLTFVTGAGQLAGGALTRVVYRLEEAPVRLVLEESVHFSPDGLARDPIDKPGERAAVLLEGFQQLRFEYLLNDGVETEWRPEWDGFSEETLPSAVRVMVWGLPGIEGEVWGQEIPVMAAHYGDSQGECDEEEIGPAPGEEDESLDDDTGDDPGGSVGE
jgi:prepilin-type N-terminal cleavage/methylation domain-containing protein